MFHFFFTKKHLHQSVAAGQATPPLFLRVIVTRGSVPDIKLADQGEGVEGALMYQDEEALMYQDEEAVMYQDEEAVMSFHELNAGGGCPSIDVVSYLSVPFKQPSGLLLPLHRAVMLSTGRGKYGVLEVSALVASGASLDRLDADGCTALFYAPGNEHVLKLLLSKGADVHVSSNNGNTALHYAAAGNSASSCSILIHHGANLMAVNANALTPRMLAQSLSKTSSTNFLASYEETLSKNIQVSDRRSTVSAATRETVYESVCESLTRKTTIVRGDNGGLGLALQQLARESVDTHTEPYTITALIPAGAAEKSGLLATGERLVEVDGTPVASLGEEDIQALIHGSPNTPVTLTIASLPRAAGGPGASRAQLAAEARGPMISIQAMEQDVGASQPAQLPTEPIKRKIAFTPQGPEARIGGPEVPLVRTRGRDQRHGPEARIAGPEARIAGPEARIAGPEARTRGRDQRQGPEAGIGAVRWNEPVPPGETPASDLDGVLEQFTTPRNSGAGNDAIAPLGDLSLPILSVPVGGQGEVEYWAESAPQIPYSSGRGGGAGGGAGAGAGATAALLCGIDPEAEKKAQQLQVLMQKQHEMQV
jgi:hypothetical protein